MSVLFIFVDGIGLGEASDSNPFHSRKWDSLEWISNGSFLRDHDPVEKEDHVFRGVDANLNVEGLPQSGTGQTALFTGENAAVTVGRHFGPFPHSQIKPILKENSIFRKTQELGKKAHFLNAYPPIFFEHARKKERWTCTTLMAKAAGIDLNSTKEVRDEKALTAEIIQNAWREKLNIDIPPVSASDAARRAWNVASENHFTLYEYYLTDKAGHSQDPEKAERVMEVLDEFLVTLLKERSSDDLLVLCSDHGNLEDLSTKTHTRNKVPLAAIGKGALEFSRANSIMDVTPSILRSLTHE